MKRYLLLLLLFSLLLAQNAKQNIRWEGTVDMGTANVIPPTSVSSGQVLYHNGTTIAGKTIYGGGTNLASVNGSPVSVCAEFNSSGIIVAATGGGLCGTGTGSGGGSPGTPALGGTGWTTVDRVVRVATATVSLGSSTWTYPGGTIPAAAATSQEIPLFTGLLNGNMRYDHVQISIGASFALGGSVVSITAGIGRPGGSTDTEMLSLFDITQSAGLFSFDRPQPPIIGSTPYDLVLTITTTGGNVSALSTGSLTVEICAYSIN
jgi:hypothetical protein